MSTTSRLFEPIQIGDLHFPNRVFMAPLTRCRASAGRVPNALMRDYYVQRASAGLILSEATAVDPMGVGYPDTPGIWSPEQMQGWKMITDAVHAAGGRMFLQLWHVGRISRSRATWTARSRLRRAPSLPRPRQPASAKEAFCNPARVEDRGDSRHRRSLPQRRRRTPWPPASTAWKFMAPMVTCSTNSSRTAPINGRTNTAGRIENRARLMLEVTDAAISVWGANRVAMHLAPRGDAHSMGDSNPAATFGYVAKRPRQARPRIPLRPRIPWAIASDLNSRRPSAGSTSPTNPSPVKQPRKLLQSGEADAIALGKLFIANPDLPRRLALRAPLNTPDGTTFYGTGPKGYTDYPALPHPASRPALIAVVA